MEEREVQANAQTIGRLACALSVRVLRFDRIRGLALLAVSLGLSLGSLPSRFPLLFIANTTQGSESPQQNDGHISVLDAIWHFTRIRDLSPVRSRSVQIVEAHIQYE